MQCVTLAGTLTGESLGQVREAFRRSASENKDVTLDMRDVSFFDADFLGLLLVLHKSLRGAGREVQLTNVPATLRRVLHWNALDYLVE